jgi:hypothetical protein
METRKAAIVEEAAKAMDVLNWLNQMPEVIKTTFNKLNEVKNFGIMWEDLLISAERRSASKIQ